MSSTTAYLRRLPSTMSFRVRPPAYTAVSEIIAISRMTVKVFCVSPAQRLTRYSQLSPSRGRWMSLERKAPWRTP